MNTLLRIVFLMSIAQLSPIHADDSSMNLSRLYDNTLHVRLDNGLSVILKRLPQSPVTAVHLRVKTGSIHEESYYGYGLSHFFEHSLFLGSKGRPKKDQFSAEIESYGGANVNAYTTYDHTAYHFTILSEYTEKGLACMEDLVFHPLFPEKEVANEMGSIQSEMDMRNDMLDSAFQEFIARFTFKKLPYKYPVIGFKDRFASLSRKQLLDYYDRRYVPNNMILTVVGNFDLAKTLDFIKKTYGGNKSRPVKEFRFQNEDAFANETAEMTHPKARFARFSLAWRSMSSFSEDMYPMDVLANLIAGGKGTILHDLLKDEKNLVEGIDASSWTPEYDGIFEISASLPLLGGRDAVKGRIDEVRKQILAELTKIASGKVDAYRVESVKREVLSSFIHGRETSMGLARGLASSVMLTGGLNYDEIYLQGVRKVKPEDVAAVAKKYLEGKAFKTICLVPPEIFKDGPLYSGSTVEKDFKETGLSFTEGKEDRRLAGLTGQAVSEVEAGKSLGKKDAAAKENLTTEKIILSNGLTVLYQRDETLPVVVASWVSRGGLSYESGAVKNGSFQLLSRLFVTGTELYSKAELVKSLRENGIDLTPFAGKSSFGLRLNLLRDRLKVGSGWFEKIMKSKTFNAEDFKKEKQSLLFSIQTRKENGWLVSSSYFRKLFFTGTPLENLEEGTEESVSPITADDLAKIKNKSMVPAGSVFSVYGDISKAELEEHFLSWLGKIPSGEKVVEPKIELKPISFSGLKDENMATLKGSSQTFFRMAYRAPSIATPDEAAFRLLNGYLSGMGGPLFKLRSAPYTNEKGVQGGRAYVLNCSYESSPTYGTFAFYTGLRFEARKEYPWAIEAFKAEVKNILAHDMSADDLRRARSAVMGQDIQQSEKLESRAFEETLMELYGFGFDTRAKRLKELSGVSASDIRRVAKKYLEGDHFTVHVLTPGD